MMNKEEMDHLHRNQKSHPPGMCWVGGKNKVVYLGIPKTASTAIRDSLNLKTVKNLRDLNPNERKYPLFTVIREPFKRFLSGYVEMIHRCESVEFLSKRNISSIDDNVEQFEYFVSNYMNDLFDPHIALQSYFLREDYDVDNVLIFEKLKTNFNSFCSKHKIRRNLIKVNSKNNSQRNMYNVIHPHATNTEWIREKIEKVLEPDIVLYEKYL